MGSLCCCSSCVLFFCAFLNYIFGKILLSFFSDCSDRVAWTVLRSCLPNCFFFFLFRFHSGRKKVSLPDGVSSGTPARRTCPFIYQIAHHLFYSCVCVPVEAERHSTSGVVDLGVRGPHAEPDFPLVQSSADFIYQWKERIYSSSLFQHRKILSFFILLLFFLFFVLYLKKGKKNVVLYFNVI